MNTIDISKMDKAEVLAALYNSSRQQGMGFMHARGRAAMSKEQASDEIKANTQDGKCYFDYLHGRVMKVEIGGNTLDPWLYDRDNGEGAAQRALAHLDQPVQQTVEGVK